MTQTIYIVSIGLICIVGLVYAIYLLKNPSNRDSLRIAPIDQDTDGNGWYKMNSMPGEIRTFNPETITCDLLKASDEARKIRFKDFL